MGPALTIVLMMSISVFIVRLATVALRLTGLSPQIAKFQALSAFSGTGFTTSEAEQIVNYPTRRRITVLLMIIGNLGLVAVFATVVVGFVNTESDLVSVLTQLGWLAFGLFCLWFFVLNSVAQNIMTAVINKILLSTTELGNLPFSRLLQIGECWVVGEHQITFGAIKDGVTIGSVCERLEGGTVMSLRDNHGAVINNPPVDHVLQAGESLIVFATERIQEHLFICPIRAKEQARLRAKLKRKARKRFELRKLRKRKRKGAATVTAEETMQKAERAQQTDQERRKEKEMQAMANQKAAQQDRPTDDASQSATDESAQKPD